MVLISGLSACLTPVICLLGCWHASEPPRAPVPAGPETRQDARRA